MVPNSWHTTTQRGVSGYKEMLKVAKELGVPEKDTVHEIRQEL
jgi:hypothetical protein